MKKLSVLLLLFAAAVTSNAQHQINSFFSPDGTLRLETQELLAASDSLVTIKHRSEDIVWYKEIYRIIDLRQKQNYQLYYPTNPDDPAYMSLYRLVLDAVGKGLPVYNKDPYRIKPMLTSEALAPRDKNLSLLFAKGSIFDEDFDTEDDDTYLLVYDSVNNAYTFNASSYEPYIRNQVKWLVYEVVFFNKHTSRMHQKIIAIAPLQPDMEARGDDAAQFMHSSLKFWIKFDDLRPYLAQRYLIQSKNSARRITFDDFFQRRLYSSYIVGEGNIYDRMILDYCTTEEEVKKEQARIEDELLNFEQDLWEY